MVCQDVKGLSLSVSLWQTVSSEGCRPTLVCVGIPCVSMFILGRWSSEVALCGRVLVPGVRHKVNWVTYFGYTSLGISKKLS